MKKLILSLFLCITVLFSYHLKADAHNNGYSTPCYTIQGGKYCNACGGTYFYAGDKFWMCLNRVNNNGYIIDRIYAEYNPQTKKLGKIITTNSNREDLVIGAMLELELLQSFISGKNIKVSAPAQTVEQYKAKLEKQKAINEANRKKQEEQAAAAAKKKAEEEAAAKAKAIQDIKEKHQKALTVALNTGTLPSCKKLYWKYLLLYVYSDSNPEPFKNIEGTELSYCKLKDNSTAMLQFKDTIDSQTGAKYRGLKLMDFTGKTKYYPWD